MRPVIAGYPKGSSNALARLQSRLMDHPEIGPVWRKRHVGPDVRKVVLRRFPFVVFYLLDGEVIDIVAVAHARRRPGYWTWRLRNTPT